MKTTEIFIPFEPVPKGRPKFTRTGHPYTPKKTKEYEKKLAEFYKSQTSDYYDEPIKVRLVFYMPIPKSASKKKRILMESGQIKHTVKPDVDNLVKSVLDACNGVAYSDDNLVTTINAIKIYASDNDVGTYMVITEDVD